MNNDGVSSPRVSKGCLDSAPFGINERLAKAALAHARATDTARSFEFATSYKNSIKRSRATKVFLSTSFIEFNLTAD
jgi:hypothetical protein